MIKVNQVIWHHLVAADDMDDNHKVSRGNEPSWSFKIQKNIVFNILSKCPISDQSHRKIANGVDKIRSDDAFPHRNSRGLLRCWRYGGLNLESDGVSCECEGDLPQGVEHSKHWIFHARCLVRIAHVLDSPSA